MKKNRLLTKNRIVWTVIYILYLFWIFTNSLDIAVESSSKSTAVMELLNQILFGGTSTLTEHLVRKLAHFSEFALAGVLGHICFSQWRKEMRSFVLCTLFVGLFIALCDETIQLFVPGRSGQIMDVWIDFLGYVVGMFVWAIAHKIWSTIKVITKR